MASSVVSRTSSLLRRGLSGWRGLSRTFASETTSKENKKDQPAVEESPGQRYFPRRCLLYVPASDEHKLKKSQTLSPDSFVFDLEDGVAVTAKEAARHTLLSFLQTIQAKDKRTEYGVRINSINSGLADDDLKVILSGEKIPHTIYLPKVESASHIDDFAQAAGKYMRKEHKDINLVIYAETAAALVNLKEIVTEAKKLEEFSIFNLDGIIFGSDDYCASIGATRSNAGQEVIVARQQVVMIAKAFDLQPIDVVFIDLKDKEGLKKQCEEGARMGFVGKQAIHPDQIDIITKSFTPTPEKIAWARKIIQLYKEHEAKGTGAFVVDGTMIDKPLLLQAENIAKLADLVEGK